MDNNEKRKRDANFKPSERSLLLTLVNKYKSVVENKKTDAVTWKEKENAWRKIEIEYNSTIEGISRTEKQLKLKYEATKKELKKSYSSHKAYVLGTGGGKHLHEPVHTEEDQQLLQTIAISVSGLQSTFDSDGLGGVPGIPVYDAASGTEAIIEFRDVEWDEPSAGFLRTPVHPALRPVDDDDTSEEPSANNDTIIPIQRTLSK